MTEIAVIFEGSGTRSEQTFPTIAHAVGHLLRHGYTRPVHTRGVPDVSSRLHKHTGRRARIDTTSTPGTWPVVVDQVTALATHDVGALVELVLDAVRTAPCLLGGPGAAAGQAAIRGFVDLDAVAPELLRDAVTALSDRHASLYGLTLSSAEHMTPGAYWAPLTLNAVALVLRERTPS